ncbi:ABC transporter permease [Actinokineospora globicatena]|uniref:ABC transporter permease n=1 Tax=Actinokineospora globicatena TaxID=103729 RepID=UPI0020A3C864|nr:ABC transporter permease [Actinokineospora globicatena]MCP2301059.1 ABC-2 type transport system permease protein [Actinokineospora globicatena]GLW77307.1 exporter of polyketide antibiotics [Actinokineospora globicatena]GLW84141.1 exporter of polyketide antibiotics [Actinokineospora globicatena]
MSGTTGTWPLVRLALRRDRVILPIWIVVLSVIPGSTVSAYEKLYPTVAAKASLNAGTGSNPSVAVLYGPAFDLSTPGGWSAWRYGSFLALFIALFAIFTVTRHTRAEEDSGRLELLGSAVVGRYAALTAGVIVAGASSLLIGVLIAAGMTGAGLPIAGAFTMGLTIAGTGLVFTAIAGVTAQLTEYSRSANGLATTVLGVAFLLRALGDSTPSASWVSWLSPLAWPQQAKPFVADDWWVFLLAVGAAIAVASIAYQLVPRRDIGAGLFASRPGPATAAKSLSSPLGLAWRLQRGSLLGWTVAVVVMGAMFGAIADGIGGLVGDSEQVKQIMERMGGTQGLVDAYLSAIVGLFGMLSAVYAVQAGLRTRSEETATHAESVLATGVSRIRWAGSHLVFAIVGPAVLLAASGLAAGLAHGLRSGDLGHQLTHTLAAAMAQLPAVWVVAGIAALLYGIWPALAVAGSWTVVAVSVLLALYGPVIGLTQAVLDVSPFVHVPKLQPGTTFTATPLLWLTGVALVAVVAGLTTFRRRDIG